MCRNTSLPEVILLRGCKQTLTTMLQKTEISFRQKLDLISKNIIRRQNALEIVSDNISTFHAENPIVGSLLRELYVGKKDVASDLVKKDPRPPGLDNSLRKRLNKLQDRPEQKDDDNNDISPPLPSPPQAPPSFPQHLLSGPPRPPPFVLPPSGRFLEPFQTSPPPPRPSSFIGISPAPSAHPPTPEDFYLLGPPSGTPSNNLYDSQIQVLTGERIAEDAAQKYPENIIYELPDDPPKLELGDGLANLLGIESEDILDEKSVNKKELENEELKNIKEEYGFEEIKDAFDEGAIPNQIDLFYGGISENFNEN